MGASSKAFADYNEAIWLDPKLVLAYYNRAIANAALGNLEQAATDFTEVIRLNPAKRQAYALRATIYRRLGDEAKATNDERTAQELSKEGAAGRLSTE